MKPKRSFGAPSLAILALALATLAYDSAQDQDVGSNKTAKPPPVQKLTSTLKSAVTPESTTTSTDTPNLTTATSCPQAEVVISSLNMREGPGTDCAVVGAASASDVFEIIGIDWATGWIQVADTHGNACWILGNSKYTHVVGTLDGVPAVKALPPPPTHTSTPTAETSPTAAPEPATDTPTPVIIPPTNTPVPPAPTSAPRTCCRFAPLGKPAGMPVFQRVKPVIKDLGAPAMGISC